MRFRLLFIISFLTLVSCNKYSHLQPSPLLLQLRQSEKTERTLYFYPSILRIINLQDNPDFYRLIRNIEKMIVYRMKDDFSIQEVTNLKSKLQEEESFEDYANISMEGQKIYFLGKEDPFHSVFIVPTGSEYYIVDVMGQINFLALSRMIQLMNSGKRADQEQFLDILQLVGARENSTQENSNALPDSNTVNTQENSDTINSDTINIED